MSLIEGKTHLRRNDARPGIIVNIDKSAHEARMKAVAFRKQQSDTILDQQDQINRLTQLVQQALGVKVESHGKN